MPYVTLYAHVNPSSGMPPTLCISLSCFICMADSSIDTDGTQKLKKRWTLAFELDPGMIGHAGVLAVFLANHGRLDEALEIISRGLDERPGDGALLRTREEIIALRRSG